jgi:outer membrane protein
MKLKSFVAVAFLMVSTYLVQAQNKIAYTNIDFIVSQLPETKTAENELNTFSRKLQEQLQAKQADIEKKGQELNERVATMTEEEMIAAQQEWETLQNSFRQLETDASEQYNRKQQDLLVPLYEKAKKTIEEVAVENGYDFVLSEGNGQIILFAPKENDITNLVFAKLGITPPADETAGSSNLLDNGNGGGN